MKRRTFLKSALAALGTGSGLLRASWSRPKPRRVVSKSNTPGWPTMVELASVQPMTLPVRGFVYCPYIPLFVTPPLAVKRKSNSEVG